MALIVNIRTLEEVHHIDLSEFEHEKRYTMSSIMSALGLQNGTPKMSWNKVKEDPKK